MTPVVPSSLIRSVDNVIHLLVAKPSHCTECLWLEAVSRVFLRVSIWEFRHGYTESGNGLMCYVRAVLLLQPRKYLNVWLLVSDGVIQGHPKNTTSRFCVLEASPRVHCWLSGRRVPWIVHFGISGERKQKSPCYQGSQSLFVPAHPRGSEKQMSASQVILGLWK